MRPDEEPLVFEDEVLVHEPSPEAPTEEPQVVPPQLTDIKEIVSENESSEPRPEPLVIEEIVPVQLLPDPVEQVPLEFTPEVKDLLVEEPVKEEIPSDPESWDNQENDNLSPYLAPAGAISDEDKKFESQKSVSRFGKRMSIDENTILPLAEEKEEENKSFSADPTTLDDEITITEKPR